MKKNILFIGVPILLAIAVFVFIKIDNPFAYKFTDIDVNTFVKLNSSKTQKMIYIKDESFKEGKVYTNVIKTVFKGSKKKIYQLDYNKLTDEEKNTFISANSTILESSKSAAGFTTPMFIVINTDGTSTIQMGVFEKNDFEQFVKDNKLK